MPIRRGLQAAQTDGVEPFEDVALWVVAWNTFVLGDETKNVLEPGNNPFFERATRLRDRRRDVDAELGQQLFIRPITPA
ncbi:MAG: hypothetical protein WBF53_03965 [Litorimonas sp.]